MKHSSFQTTVSSYSDSMAPSCTCISRPPPPSLCRSRLRKSILAIAPVPIFFSNSNLQSVSMSPSRSLLNGARRKYKRVSPVSAAATDDSTSQPEIADGGRKLTDLPTLARRFWKVAAPYWFSDDKIQGRIQLAAVFALTLGTTGISVGFNFLGRDFYNALANKDQEQFTKQLLYYLAAFVGGIPFFVLRDYSKEVLSLRWRSWMTSYYMDRYLKNQTFYKIQSQSIIDNPDQRIVDDLSSFTATALSFSLTMVNAAVDLISFSNILFGIYPPLFLVLILYSIGGTAISIFLGKGLVSLNFLQEKKEADFRFGLVRVRENAESIAFYGGEENELQLLLQRFRSAYENLTRLLISSRNLEFFTSGYRYLIQILPAAVVAPMYFSGKIEFGVINQSVSAFNHILGDFSLIVFQFQSISAFSAIIDRLGEFDDVLDGSSSRSGSDAPEEIHTSYSNMKSQTSSETNGSLDTNLALLNIESLTLQAPRSETTLLRDFSITIYEKDHLLITGPSGSGKTSLLRAIAGLWNTGRGKITFYTRNEDDIKPYNQQASLILDVYNNDSEKRRLKGVFFLPQRPYMVLGTLRQQLLYPTWFEDSITFQDSKDKQGSLPFMMDGRKENVNNNNNTKSSKRPTTGDLLKALDDVRLGYILARFDGLDTICEWSSVLSLGEQQRLAFARLLLSKPHLALLDESTSALDEANETHLYKMIEDAGITYVSIGHRSSLYKHHNKFLHILKEEDNDDPSSMKPNWYVIDSSIDQEGTFKQYNP